MKRVSVRLLWPLRLPRRADPRPYQIAALAGLLAYGWLVLDLDITKTRALLILGVALGSQAAWSGLLGLRFEPRSALISGLSLCLLFRSGSSLLAVGAASVAISSKFLLRFHGKHVFNPTNLGLVALLLVSDRVWISPGQWGSAALFGFLVACAGILVVHRAERSDVTWAFLTSHLVLLLARAGWLGDPAAVPLHQVANGGLLLFAFFMISDPRTTPDSRIGRILFALLVSAGAGWVQFGLFRPNGLLFSLAACSPLVPLIDRLWPGPRYAWGRAAPSLGRPQGGNEHAPVPDGLRAPDRLLVLG
jgi:Na+-transporting NADH:ubiquinone oxidoreductase subunit NqrB